jgi:hypothetical protein
MLVAARGKEDQINQREKQQQHLLEQERKNLREKENLIEEKLSQLK